jgi:hypothetical protein
MKNKKRNVTFCGVGLKTLVAFIFLQASHSSWAGRALDNANTTTNTDTNKDGTSDGNVDTIFKDNVVKGQQATKVSSHNLRGSMQDAKCIAGTGAACSAKDYFKAENIGTQIDALKASFQNSVANIGNESFRASSGASGNAVLNAANHTCSNVPSAFGCSSGDFSLLNEAREAIAYSLTKGDYPPEIGNNMLSKVDQFVQDLKGVRDTVLKGFNSGLDLFAMNKVPSGADLAGIDSGDSQKKGPKFSYEDYSGAGSDFDRNQTATKGIKNWVGPKSLEQMAAAIEVYNGLEAYDARSGKLLTLWQRATRRYQAFDLSRAYTLAKTEGTRGQMMSKRAPASTTAQSPK